jgi:hypothetical protein
VKATGLQRPERGTIGKSASRRDYPMSTPTSYSSDIDNFLAAARREKRLVLQKWTFRSGQIAQLPKPKAGCGPIVYACQQPIQTVYYLGGTNLHWRSAPAGTLLRNSG